MDRWYEIKNKIIDNELWFNANDLIYGLEDFRDLVKDDNISLIKLTESLKKGALESLKNARRNC